MKSLLSSHFAMLTMLPLDSAYYGVYFFFASMMILAAVFVFFLIPETKGIPLEKMDSLFEPSLPARRAHKVVLAEVQAEDREFRRQSVGHESAEESKERDIVNAKQVESV